MGFSYLCKRNNCYYFRIRVPKDLKTHLEISEIKKSLSTKYYSLAVSLAKQWAFKTEKLFTLIRSGVLTDEQLKYLIAQDLRPKTKLSSQSHQQPSPKPIHIDSKTLFSTIVKGYIKEKQLAESWTDKTKEENLASIDLFINIIGNKPVKTYNRQDFIKFREILSQLPPNMNKAKLYQGKSIDEVLTMNPKETLSKRTINKRLIHVSSVFNHALLNQYINANYASELLLPITSTAQDDKKVFSKEDLQNVIDNLPSDKPERFWIPLIAMLSGARLTEICQLYTEDIKLIDEIYCFDINDDKDKKLKNTPSKRQVAVHPLLIELGLIKHLEQCRVRGDERLWMELKSGRDGYGTYFSRIYKTFNTKYVTTDPKKTFHSFRHTAINDMKQAEVNDTLISEIAGHKVDSMSMGRYGKKYKPETQLEAIKVLGEGLDLTLLREIAKSLIY